jgi:hypothetical protein
LLTQIFGLPATPPTHVPVEDSMSDRPVTHPVLLFHSGDHKA